MDLSYEKYTEDVWKRICKESKNYPPSEINMFMVGSLFKLRYWYGILLDPKTPRQRVFIGKHEGIISLFLFTDPEIAKIFADYNFKNNLKSTDTLFIRYVIPSQLASLEEYGKNGVESMIFNVNINECAYRLNIKILQKMYQWHIENDPRFSNND